MITQMGSPGLGQGCDLGKATRELLADWTTEDWRGLRELAPPSGRLVGVAGTILVIQTSHARRVAIFLEGAIGLVHPTQRRTVYGRGYSGA